MSLLCPFLPVVTKQKDKTTIEELFQRKKTLQNKISSGSKRTAMPIISWLLQCIWNSVGIFVGGPLPQKFLFAGPIKLSSLLRRAPLNPRLSNASWVPARKWTPGCYNPRDTREEKREKGAWRKRGKDGRLKTSARSSRNQRNPAKTTSYLGAVHCFP